jgi:2-haloacid dehalogenase
LSPREIVFVSSNGWDVSAAAWFGFRTFWVNRAGLPREELGVVPEAEGTTLADLPAFVTAHP